MTAERQAIYLNAVPLLVLGAAYLTAGASLLPQLIRSRSAFRDLEPALALVFPFGGLAAIVFGLLVLRDREPVGGSGWPGFLAILLAFVPALVFFARFRERTLLLTAPGIARAAEELDRLRRAQTVQDAARAIVERAQTIGRVEFGGVVLINEETRTAEGIVAHEREDELGWFPDVRIDLEREPSGVASAYHDAAPFAVYDTRASKRVSQRLVERSGVESAAYVPMLASQRVIGVIVVGSTGRKRAFGSDELAELQALAGEAGPVLERLRARTASDRDVAVARLADQVRTEADLDAVLGQTMQDVAAGLGADRCFVRLGDPEGELRIKAQWHAAGLEPLEGSNLSRLAASNLAMRRRATVAIADVATSRELRAPDAGGPHGLLELGSRAVLAVPIVVFGELIGVLAVHRTTPGPWSAGDVQFLEALVRELGLGLHTANLLVENERRLEIQRGFYRMATVLGQPLSLRATLDAVAQAAGESFGGSYAAVVVPSGESLHLAGAHGLPDALRSALEEGIAAEDDALRLSSSGRKILGSRKLSVDERFSARWRELGRACGFESLLVVPLDAGDDVRGGLVLVFFEDERTLRDDDVELARHLAGAAGAALERSELFEAERTSRSLAQQLARTGSVLVAELDPAAVIDEVAEHAPALLGADACAIRTIDGDELQVTAVAGDDLESALGARSDVTGRLSGEVAHSRRPLAVADAAADPALLASDVVLSAGYAAYLGVPLVGSGGLHGVVAVYDRRPRAWRPEEVEALVALAVNTSAALSSAELYQRVAQQEERSTAILENVADGIVAVDRAGDVVLWNRAAEEATGVPAGEALGRQPQQILGRSLSGSTLLPLGRSGAEKWLSINEAVMRDPAGLVAGRIFAFRDISADRLVEEMKSEFVSTVSHELRGPLTSIYGFAETLLREDVLFGDEERKTFLGYISSESERLTRIVDALLSVARIDSGDLQVNLAATDVQLLVTDVVASAKENGTANGHRFVLDLPTEPLAAEADPEKLRQVLLQLVDNAVKYSPDGGRVTVAARRKRDTVEFQVVDEGPGIPAAERERIFRKFYRADDARGGTGIGLYLAEGFVKAMGGRIRVESDEGKGSRFAFELPVARV